MFQFIIKEIIRKQYLHAKHFLEIFSEIIALLQPTCAECFAHKVILYKIKKSYP